MLNDKEIIPLSEAKKKDSKKTIIIYMLFIAVMFGIFYFATQVTTGQRMVREVQNSITGQVSLSTGIYKGDLDFGNFTGDGRFTFSTGDIYEGEWLDNQFNGQGNFSSLDLGTYAGEFSDGKKSGSGTFNFKDGSVYDGTWKFDVPNGQGELTLSNGSTYNGTFADGRLQGTGTMTYADGSIYEGEFANSKRSGKGTYTWADKTVYSGDWYDDAMNGEGAITLSSGLVIDGKYCNNAVSLGYYTIQSNKNQYKFQINDGEIDSVSISFANGNSYVGECTSSSVTGDGTYTFANGDQYTGSFKGGVRSGNGKYVWSNGAYYSGAWVDDKMNGSGEYRYPSSKKGISLTGTFKNNLPTGTCVYKNSDGQFNTNWSGGRCKEVLEG